MKKIITITIITIIVLLASACVCHNDNNVYPLTARVVEVDRVADVVTCEDGAGNLWEFESCEDWEEDDFVSLLMNDNGTNETIYDDIIEMVRYSGIFEG